MWIESCGFWFGSHLRNLLKIVSKDPDKLFEVVGSFLESPLDRIQAETCQQRAQHPLMEALASRSGCWEFASGGRHQPERPDPNGTGLSPISIAEGLKKKGSVEHPADLSLSFYTSTQRCGLSTTAVEKEEHADREMVDVSEKGFHFRLSGLFRNR
jgi:hypothetical protein